jgi:signal transduction histidine kinase
MLDPNHSWRRVRVRGVVLSASSLAGRLASLQRTLAATLILLFAGAAIWISSAALKHQESAFLLDAASQTAGSIGLEWREEGSLLQGAKSALSEDVPVGVHIRVLDASGREIYSVPPGDRSSRGTWRETRVPIAGGGWVVASVPIDPRRRAVLVLVLALVVTAIPLFVGVTALSRTIARRALGPLSRIASQVERSSGDAAPGRFGNAEDPAEVAALAEAFDRLLARIQEVLAAERHFTRDAAHELRTPLTVLCGELEYAIQDSSLPPRVREGLDRALLQGRAMTDLVEALLLLRDSDRDPSAREELSQPVNLSDLVRDMEREFREPAIARARDLRVVAEDEVLVAGHSTLLASAIRNLLSNALKFTSVGQPVSVRVFNGTGRGTVLVEDAGPGIAAVDRERVFDPFYRSAEARAAHDGFGLGLPILRRVARAHGGDVRLSESPLGGARFELFIPSWISRS